MPTAGLSSAQIRAAKPALERTRLDEGFLHRVQRVAVGKTLDRDELGAVSNHLDPILGRLCVSCADRVDLP